MVAAAVTSRAHETKVELVVPFHDVDPLGIVWHGHYLKYLEVARTALLEPLGLDGDELVATGFRFYMADVRCRHVSPLRYRDRVRVTAWLREWEQRIWVSYDVHNVGTDRQAARAHTVLVVVDAAGVLQFDVPEVLRGRLDQSRVRTGQPQPS